LNARSLVNTNLGSKPAKPAIMLKLIASVVIVSAGFSSLYTYWKFKKEEEKLNRFGLCSNNCPPNVKLQMTFNRESLLMGISTVDLFALTC